MSKVAKPTEIYDDSGNLLRIEFYDLEGKHVVDVLWDDREEQTIGNRIEFIKWAYHILDSKEYQVLK